MVEESAVPDEEGEVGEQKEVRAEERTVGCAPERRVRRVWPCCRDVGCFHKCREWVWV